MSWLLAGCYGLVWISISGALQISQTPRFIGARTKQNVKINCSTSAGTEVQWYKLNKYDEDRNRAVEVKKGGKIDIPFLGTKLRISGVGVEDKGVYFCKANDTWGPGTELQVVEPLNRAKAQHRTQMKDGLIIFQAVLLAVCTVALMLRNRVLQEEKDSIYEDPEDDHIYEGLGGQANDDLYEDLAEYTQPEGAEDPWQ